jgi:hypothetical protein
MARQEAPRHRKRAEFNAEDTEYAEDAEKKADSSLCSE